jgi:hypothetical protein
VNELLAGFIGAGLASVAALIVAGIVSFVKRRVRVTGPHAETLEIHSKQLSQLQPLVAMLLSVQKPQLLALLGILEALKDKMNGEFERATDAIRGALDAFDGLLVKIAAGKCFDEKGDPIT